jgi:hypothetical protein
MTRTVASDRPVSTRSRTSLLAATRPLGRAALSCGLAGALSLGAAGAALASGHDAAPRGGADQGRAAAPGASAAAPGSCAAAPRKSENRRPAASTTDTRPQQGATATKPTGSRQAAGADEPKASGSRDEKASGSRASAPQRSQDPRGNNGTVKVDGQAWDARVDNEPHPSCAFRVTFFGFDEGQTADITITGVAPTGGGVLLHETAVPTSGDAAGGAGRDHDGATRVYTADDLGLDAVTPHPQQGYHLKVAVDSLEAPGGAKQKVLWLEPCDAPAAVTQPEVGGFEQGEGGAAPGTVGGLDTVGAAPGAEVPEVGADSEPARRAVAAPAALRAEAAYAELVAADAVVASPRGALRSTQQASALPTSLAFTGAAGLQLLALAGAAASATGAALLAARRRASAAAR